jgi:hypothetical protein
VVLCYSKWEVGGSKSIGTETGWVRVQVCLFGLPGVSAEIKRAFVTI